MTDNLEKAAGAAFEPKLRALGLSVEQIEQQDLPELEESLRRINEAMARPEQFGTYRLTVSADSAVIITKARSEAHVEVGILPILLVRKALILERIKLLRPIDQLVVLRDEIAKRVDDGALRGELIRVLEGQQAEQKEHSRRLQSETDEVEAALQAERQVHAHALSLLELKGRIDAIEKGLAEKPGKWEVALIIGGLIGAAASIAAIVQALGG